MKKLTVITFGLIGLIFGLVFTSTKIQGAEITSSVYSYYAQKNNNTGVFEVFSDELKNPGEQNNYISYQSFLDRWDTISPNNSIVFINFTRMYVEYEDYNNVNYSYWGNTDLIIIKKTSTSLYDFEFWSYGQLKATFQTDNIIPPNDPFITMTSDIETYYQNGYDQGKLDGYIDGYQPGYDDGYLVGVEDSQSNFTDGYNKGKDIGYKNGKLDGEFIGYEKGLSDGFEQGEIKGLLDGHKLGVSDVYFDGFGGFINPDTNLPYDVTASFPYGQGYNAGQQAENDYSFTGILFQVFGGLGALLSIQLLPNITIGAIIAVPLVFGIVYFILGKRSGE